MGKTIDSAYNGFKLFMTYPGCLQLLQLAEMPESSFWRFQGSKSVLREQSARKIFDPHQSALTAQNLLLQPCQG